MLRGKRRGVGPFDRGRTLTHEVSHWLDLLHIWGDDMGACQRSDNIADTPNQGGPNYGVPAYPNVSCNNHPHGDVFMNFMDYVDDEAMVMFTRGQALRMQETIQGPRSSLLRSRGLLNPTNPISDTEGAVILKTSRSSRFANSTSIPDRLARRIDPGCSGHKLARRSG